MCKWMARYAFLKLFLVTTSIQCCWRQARARKELQRLQQEDAKELSITLVGDLGRIILKIEGRIRSTQRQILILVEDFAEDQPNNKLNHAKTL